MLARRMLFIVAILMGVPALTAGLTAPPQQRRGGALEATPPVTAPAPATPSTLVERTLDASAPGPRTVAVDEGDQLRLTVRGDDLSSVELVGLGQLQAVAPDSPAGFGVLADP